ncbi:MAG: phosphodiester glycosidase family protein [Tissierellaceae bacterium]|nr:phosphodiester glycosidase family protein [Tissierellaceae bacterium]
MRKRSFILAIIIVLTTFSTSFAAPENVGVSTKTFTINGLKKTVNVVTVDLNSPDIELEVVTAYDGVGGAENFQSMINRKKPIAAINANYFASYDTLEPYGSIMKNKKLTYLEGTNTSFLIKDKNEVNMEVFSTRIKGYLDGNKENKWNNKTQSMDFYVFDVWYLNNKPVDTTGVYLYTPDRGESIELKDGTAIVVKEDKITKLVKNPGTINIPKDGYIIYYAKDAANDNYINNRFKIGRTVEFEYVTSIPDYENGDKKEEVVEKEVKTSQKTKLFGSINKKTKNEWNNDKNAMDFYLFTIWYINTKPIDSSGAYLYTPERGESFEVPEGKAITVKNGKITKVELKTEKVTIPKDGYVLYFGKDAVTNDYIKNRFVVGKTVDFYHEKTLKFDTTNIIKEAVKNNEAALEEPMGPDLSTTEIDLNKANHMISAGPYLVKDGKVIVDAVKQGFRDPKISVYRLQRSALGITADNKLILVTGGNLNMDELAKIMVELKCDRAMNLDGGASSALYAKGKMITPAGRNLNTVLMIHDIKK